RLPLGVFLFRLAGLVVRLAATAQDDSERRQRQQVSHLPELEPHDSSSSVCLLGKPGRILHGPVPGTLRRSWALPSGGGWRPRRRPRAVYPYHGTERHGRLEGRAGGTPCCRG